MGSAERPPPEARKAGELAASIVVGAILFAAIGAAEAALTDDDMLGNTVAGAIAGVLIGFGWFWTSRRAERFRSTFKPAEQSLTAPAPAAVGAAGPDVSPRRRYYHRHLVTVSVVLLILWLFLPIAASFSASASVGVRLFFWGMTLLPLWMLTGACLTYLDVGPTGLRVSRLLRRDTITWSELREVRWLRKDDYDTLLLVTTDGREIKSNAVLVSSTGRGRARGSRVLADIERTWAQAGG